MESKEHWERVYQSKAVDAVSWYQEHAGHSLHFIEETGVSTDAAIIDIGGGASVLVDDLLARGHANLTVLDVSGAALAVVRERLGDRGDRVRWIESDIRSADLPAAGFDVWHDRAVFHFLTDADDRHAYVDAVVRAVRLGGHVIIATFAEDGPMQCSGLPVVRYGVEALCMQFGDSFALVHHERQAHQTPFGTEQQFLWCRFQKIQRELPLSSS